MDLFNTIPLMPKAVSMPENCYSSGEALGRAAHCEMRKIAVVGVVAAADGRVVAGIVVAIDPDV
jgi:hypothetical protein